MKGDFAADGARRQRRNGRTAVTRVAVVVLVVAGLVVAGGLRLRDDRRPDAATPAPVDLATARPAVEVWPQAVVTVPGTVDGRPVWPVGRVDDDLYLVVPGDRSRPYQLPVVLTAGTGAVYDLFTDPPGDRFRTLAWASVGERSIVAVTSVDTGTYHATEVWTAPRYGGPAVQRALFQHSDRTLVVTAYEVGDTVFASVSRAPSPESAPATRIVRISDTGVMKTVVDGSGCAPGARGRPPTRSGSCGRTSPTRPRSSCSTSSPANVAAPAPRPVSHRWPAVSGTASATPPTAWSRTASTARGCGGSPAWGRVSGAPT